MNAPHCGHNRELLGGYAYIKDKNRRCIPNHPKESRAMKDYDSREGASCVTALPGETNKEESHTIINRTSCGGAAYVIALQAMT